MSINGLNGATAAVATPDMKETLPAPAASSSHKALYGDPSRSEGLMNTMSIMKQLSVSAQALVNSRNTSLQ
jgi:hypothetical protein